MGTSFKPMACGFHSHTDEGSLDSGSTVSNKIAYADKLGRIADCVTDHGTMNALCSHWVAAKKAKTSKSIKSIHGIELYVIDDQRPPKVFKNGNSEPRYYHLTVHFKDVEAYNYFCRLTPVMESRAIVKFGEPKPLVTRQEVEGIAGHITIGSGCLIGMVMKNLLPDEEFPLHQRLQWAKENYMWMRRVAGKDNFFVEVFPHRIEKNWIKPKYKGKVKQSEGFFAPILEKNHVHGPHCEGKPHFKDECGHDTIQIDIQYDANRFVLAMADIYKDPIIISEDNHFADPEEIVVQEIRLGNGMEKWKFSNNYCMRDSDEWAANLKSILDVKDRDIEEWIDNSYKFVELFNNYKMETAKDRILLPNIEMVYGESGSTKQKLHELIKKHGRMPSILDPKYQEYKDRLEMEISVLADNGVADFLPYVFVIEDAAEYARKNDILCSCRGSAGGSLVCYLLNISVTDPIKYGLQFERFLTLGRIKSGSLPDIDTDWQDRGLVIKYILEKYGSMAALISTNMLMRVKSSIRDVERFRTGQVSQATNELLIKVKPPASTSDRDWLFGFTDKTTGAYTPGLLEQNDPIAEEFRQYTESAVWTDDNGKERKIWDEVLKCLATTKTKGVHPGGIVITPGPVHHYMPLITPKEEGMLATAYTMKYVEEVGGVKYDFLGVKTLASLGISMRALRDIKGVNLVWGEFQHDPDVYTKIIHSGKLAGLFQISTPTMRPYVLKIKPTDIMGISNICSLVRPGALDAPSPDPSDPATVSAADYYVMCAQGVKQPYYIHEDLIPILSDSFGMILTQEQTLRIFRDLAGYDFETAEFVRRGVAKKDKELLEKHGLILKEKCIAKGWSKDQASRLLETVMASARYSFNCAHSTAYAIQCYNGAWIKHHHPAYFWLGELTVRNDDQDKLREYMSECSDLVMPVSITQSDSVNWRIETVDGKEKLRPPLRIIKGCGTKSVENVKAFLCAKNPQDLIVHEISSDTEESTEGGDSDVME